MKDRMRETTHALNSLKGAITALEWAARDDLGMDLLASCIHEIGMHDTRLGKLFAAVEERARKNAAVA